MRTAPLLMLALLALPAAIGARSAAADEPRPARPEAPDRLTLTTERVVVFKDGHGLFVKRGTATADAEGRVHTGEVPEGALLGCFWAWGEGHRVLGLHAGWVEQSVKESRETDCLTVLELLRANQGQTLTLGLMGEPAHTLEARIVEVLELGPEDVPPADPVTSPGGSNFRFRSSPREAGAADPPLERTRDLAPTGGAFVVLDTLEGLHRVMAAAEVRSLTGKDLATRTTRVREVTTRSKRLTLDLGREAAGKPAEVHLAYFAEGIRWIPTYRVGGALVDQAELALQGEVVNAAEDVAGAALDLVVGVPSFRFADVPSPLSLERTLRGVLQQDAPQLASQSMANSFRNDAGDERGGGAGAGALALAPELATEQGGDLFVYKVGAITLKKGERASYPLWQATSGLRHLYTLDASIVRDERSGSYDRRVSARRAAPDGATRLAALDVWHELQLANASEVPWTTGAALILKGDLPLGQALLGYTSIGASTLLPVTVAVDVQARYAETETRREPDAVVWNGIAYVRITKSAVLSVTNRRKDAITLRAAVSIGGRISEAGENGRITADDLHSADWANGSSPINGHGDVVWELTLEPGVTKALPFTFQFHVH